MNIFDELIREGRDIEALRYVAKEYYGTGKMGYTRKTLLERMADMCEEQQHELERLNHQIDAMKNCDNCKHPGLSGYYVKECEDCTPDNYKWQCRDYGAEQEAQNENI